MRVFYTILIHLYSLMVGFAGLFSAKAKLWSDGRKNLLDKIKSEVLPFEGKTIWIHSASLGEFEQGIPLIEEIKNKYPKVRIIITFFSPSGYEIRKDYALADHIYYLPADTPSNAHDFLSIIKPNISIFIKYEFWYNYLNELDKLKIPMVFISAIFRPQQVFFKFYGFWFLNHLKKANHFFVQNEDSKGLLEDAGIAQVSISGDTRFDRVASIAQSVKPNKLVEHFKGNHSLFLAGSTWPEDEKYLASLVEQFPKTKFIIAPHIINAAHISQIQQLFLHSIKYSEATISNISSSQVLIIDNMGMLSSLYQYANFALIGGGFGAGIHNTLEAATFGMPIFIGPNYYKFQEAKDLIDEEVVFVFENAEQLFIKFNELNIDAAKTQSVVESSKRYVQSKTGATKMILNTVKEYL